MPRVGVRSRAVAVFVAMCVIAVSCGGSSGSNGDGAQGTASAPPSSTTLPGTAAERQESAWDQILDGISEEGTVGVDTALQAFALAYGPLPGVEVPKGSTGDLTSGTVAVRWAIAHWDEFTDEQRAAAAAAVPALAEADSAGIAGLRTRPADKRPPTYYAALAAGLAAEIEAATGVHLTSSIDAREGPTFTTTSVLAETASMNAQNGFTGEATRCSITFSPLGAAESDAGVAATMAHEVWHCFEAEIVGLDWFYSQDSPSWIIEGQAEWVGESLRPEPQDGFWAPYLLEPGKSLFARSYDAIGFYADLATSGIDTWHRLMPMLETRTNAAAFEASEATSDQFLDTWASGWWRETWSEAWTMDGPGILDLRPEFPVLQVANDGTTKLGAVPYTAAVALLSSTADVLRLTSNGHVRLGDPKNQQDYVLASSNDFCTRPGGCVCPEGTKLPGVPPMPLTPDSALAVSAGPVASDVAVAGISLEKYCIPDEPSGLLRLPDDPCTLITVEEATAISGFAVVPFDTALTNEGSRIGGYTGVGCTYRAAELASEQFSVAVVRIDAFDLGAEAAALFDEYRASLASLAQGPIDDLGDDNFYICANPCDVVNLTVRWSNIIVVISVLTATGLAQATELAPKVRSRLIDV